MVTWRSKSAPLLFTLSILTSRTGDGYPGTAPYAYAYLGTLPGRRLTRSGVGTRILLARFSPLTFPSLGSSLSYAGTMGGGASNAGAAAEQEEEEEESVCMRQLQSTLPRPRKAKAKGPRGGLGLGLVNSNSNSRNRLQGVTESAKRKEGEGPKEEERGKAPLREESLSSRKLQPTIARPPPKARAKKAATSDTLPLVARPRQQPSAPQNGGGGGRSGGYFVASVLEQTVRVDAIKGKS